MRFRLMGMSDKLCLHNCRFGLILPIAYTDSIGGDKEYSKCPNTRFFLRSENDVLSHTGENSCVVDGYFVVSFPSARGNACQNVSHIKFPTLLHKISFV